MKRKVEFLLALSFTTKGDDSKEAAKGCKNLKTLAELVMLPYQDLGHSNDPYEPSKEPSNRFGHRCVVKIQGDHRYIRIMLGIFDNYARWAEIEMKESWTLIDME